MLRFFLHESFLLQLFDDVAHQSIDLDLLLSWKFPGKFCHRGKELIKCIIAVSHLGQLTFEEFKPLLLIFPNALNCIKLLLSLL